MKTLRRLVLMTVVAALVGGCAPTNELLRDDPDPFEGFNRAMFAFNEAADKAVIKPVARAYQTVLPTPVNNSITNFFSNLNDVVVLANSLLQFRLHDAAMNSSRIVFNTTFGVLGLFDVASHMELPKQRKDFGQTLGRWGFSEGYFIVLPILGPSTVRDAFGLVGNFYVSPVTWATDSSTTQWSLWGLDLIDRRAGFLRLERAFADAQIDPYSFQRSAYLQQRRNLVYDGSPPQPDFDFDFDFDFDDLDVDSPPE
ncbi:MAG: VacJ family lipoprotein [Candidatus Competibacteraceae bacterium]|nr:MAG: VacJ family lipoprotein [Candidatus Competibacteraceae bacterium]